MATTTFPPHTANQPHLFCPRYYSPYHQEGQAKHFEPITLSSSCPLERRIEQSLLFVMSESHFHSEECPLVWLLEVYLNEQVYYSELGDWLVVSERIPLHKYFTFLWLGLHCTQCSKMYNQYLLKNYCDLLQLMLWSSKRVLSNLKDYVTFYDLTSFLCENTRNGEGVDVFAAMEELSQRLAKQRVDAVQNLRDYFSIGKIEFKDLLQAKRMIKAQMSEQLTFFEVGFCLAQAKHHPNQQYLDRFISKYINKTSVNAVEIIVKICHYSHQKNNLKEAGNQLTVALRAKIERELRMGLKRKNQLLEMLETSPKPDECSCLIHYEIKKCFKDRGGKGITLNIPRTSSKMLNEEEVMVGSAVVEFKMVESEVLSSKVDLNSECVARMVTDGKQVPKQHNSVVISSQPVQTEPEPKSKQIALQHQAVVLQSQSVPTQSELKVLSGVESSKGSKSVPDLFASHLFQALTNQDFVSKIRSEYEAGSGSEKEEWRNVISRYKNQLGKLYRQLSFQ